MTEPTASDAAPLPAWMLVLCALAIVATCGLYWALGGRAFADFATYADIADELSARGAEFTLLGPEGLSRGLLRSFRLLFGAGDYAVEATALLCQVLVAVAVAVAARRREVIAANLFLSIALFVPLLALVTVRATPAYLLCAAAVARARLSDRSRISSVAATAAFGLLFHLSAAFVLVAACGAAVVPSRLSRVAWFALAAGAGAAALVLRQSFDVGTVVALAGSAAVLANPLFAERLAYFSEAAAPVSVFHLAYFVFASLLVYRIVLAAPPHPSDRLVLSLYVLYCACLVSPVVAFRNSYYLLLPIVVTARRPVLPFGDLLLGQVLHGAVCAAVLVFSIVGVLQPG